MTVDLRLLPIRETPDNILLIANEALDGLNGESTGGGASGEYSGPYAFAGFATDDPSSYTSCTNAGVTAPPTVLFCTRIDPYDTWQLTSRLLRAQSPALSFFEEPPPLYSPDTFVSGPTWGVMPTIYYLNEDPLQTFDPLCFVPVTMPPARVKGVHAIHRVYDERAYNDNSGLQIEFNLVHALVITVSDSLDIIPESPRTFNSKPRFQPSDTVSSNTTDIYQNYLYNFEASNSEAGVFVLYGQGVANRIDNGNLPIETWKWRHIAWALDLDCFTMANIAGYGPDDTRPYDRYQINFQDWGIIDSNWGYIPHFMNSQPQFTIGKSLTDGRVRMFESYSGICVDVLAQVWTQSNDASFSVDSTGIYGWSSDMNGQKWAFWCFGGYKPGFVYNRSFTIDGANVEEIYCDNPDDKPGLLLIWNYTDYEFIIYEKGHPPFSLFKQVPLDPSVTFDVTWFDDKVVITGSAANHYQMCNASIWMMSDDPDWAAKYKTYTGTGLEQFQTLDISSTLMLSVPLDDLDGNDGALAQNAFGGPEPTTVPFLKRQDEWFSNLDYPWWLYGAIFGPNTSRMRLSPGSMANYDGKQYGLIGWAIKQGYYDYQPRVYWTHYNGPRSTWGNTYASGFDNFDFVTELRTEPALFIYKDVNNDQFMLWHKNFQQDYSQNSALLYNGNTSGVDGITEYYAQQGQTGVSAYFSPSNDFGSISDNESLNWGYPNAVDGYDTINWDIPSGSFNFENNEPNHDYNSSSLSLNDVIYYYGGTASISQQGPESNSDGGTFDANTPASVPIQSYWGGVLSAASSSNDSGGIAVEILNLVFPAVGELKITISNGTTTYVLLRPESEGAYWPDPGLAVQSDYVILEFNLALDTVSGAGGYLGNGNFNADGYTGGTPPFVGSPGDASWTVTIEASLDNGNSGSFGAVNLYSWYSVQTWEVDTLGVRQRPSSWFKYEVPPIDNYAEFAMSVVSYSSRYDTVKLLLYYKEPFSSDLRYGGQVEVLDSTNYLSFNPDGSDTLYFALVANSGLEDYLNIEIGWSLNSAYGGNLWNSKSLLSQYPDNKKIRIGDYWTPDQCVLHCWAEKIGYSMAGRLQGSGDQINLGFVPKFLMLIIPNLTKTVAYVWVDFQTVPQRIIWNHNERFPDPNNDLIDVNATILSLSQEPGNTIVQGGYTVYFMAWAGEIPVPPDGCPAIGTPYQVQRAWRSHKIENFTTFIPPQQIASVDGTKVLPLIVGDKLQFSNLKLDSLSFPNLSVPSGIGGNGQVDMGTYLLSPGKIQVGQFEFTPDLGGLFKPQDYFKLEQPLAGTYGLANANLGAITSSQTTGARVLVDTNHQQKQTISCQLQSGLVVALSWNFQDMNSAFSQDWDSPVDSLYWQLVQTGNALGKHKLLRPKEFVQNQLPWKINWSNYRATELATIEVPLEFIWPKALIAISNTEFFLAYVGFPRFSAQVPTGGNCFGYIGQLSVVRGSTDGNEVTLDFANKIVIEQQYDGRNEQWSYVSEFVELDVTDRFLLAFNLPQANSPGFVQTLLFSYDNSTKELGIISVATLSIRLFKDAAAWTSDIRADGLKRTMLATRRFFKVLQISSNANSLQLVAAFPQSALIPSVIWNNKLPYKSMEIRNGLALVTLGIYGTGRDIQLWSPSSYQINGFIFDWDIIQTSANKLTVVFSKEKYASPNSQYTQNRQFYGNTQEGLGGIEDVPSQRPTLVNVTLASGKLNFSNHAIMPTSTGWSPWNTASQYFMLSPNWVNIPENSGRNTIVSHLAYDASGADPVWVNQTFEVSTRIGANAYGLSLPNGRQGTVFLGQETSTIPPRLLCQSWIVSIDYSVAYGISGYTKPFSVIRQDRLSVTPLGSNAVLDFGLNTTETIFWSPISGQFHPETEIAQLQIDSLNTELEGKIIKVGTGLGDGKIILD